MKRYYLQFKKPLSSSWRFSTVNPGDGFPSESHARVELKRKERQNPEYAYRLIEMQSCEVQSTKVYVDTGKGECFEADQTITYKAEHQRPDGSWVTIGIDSQFETVGRLAQAHPPSRVTELKTTKRNLLEFKPEVKIECAYKVGDDWRELLAFKQLTGENKVRLVQLLNDCPELPLKYRVVRK